MQLTADGELEPVVLLKLETAREPQLRQSAQVGLGLALSAVAVACVFFVELAFSTLALALSVCRCLELCAVLHAMRLHVETVATATVGLSLLRLSHVAG
jgi:hypothetical protein